MTYIEDAVAIIRDEFPTADVTYKTHVAPVGFIERCRRRLRGGSFDRYDIYHLVFIKREGLGSGIAFVDGFENIREYAREYVTRLEAAARNQKEQP